MQGIGLTSNCEFLIKFLTAVISSQSENMESYNVCLSLNCMKSIDTLCLQLFTVPFLVIQTWHLTILGLSSIKNKLTSVLCVCPLIDHKLTISLSKSVVDSLTCGSRINSHFDNDMTQFMINKRRDANLLTKTSV